MWQFFRSMAFPCHMHTGTDMWWCGSSADLQDEHEDERIQPRPQPWWHQGDLLGDQGPWQRGIILLCRWIFVESCFTQVSDIKGKRSHSMGRVAGVIFSTTFVSPFRHPRAGSWNRQGRFIWQLHLRLRPRRPCWRWLHRPGIILHAASFYLSEAIKLQGLVRSTQIQYTKHTCHRYLPTEGQSKGAVASKHLELSEWNLYAATYANY